MNIPDSEPPLSSPPFIAVVPARLASTRLPNKPLADIGGKPMVIRVAEQARASGAERVLVATDSEAVCEAAAAHGFEAVMTSAAHHSGTDRIAEVAARLGWDDASVVVNVQGDEPLIDPALISAVANRLQARPDCVMATAAHAITERGEIFSPNVVKVVVDARDTALYFSRAPIPWLRDEYGRTTPNSTPPSDDGAGAALRHIGIYAYRVGFLSRYPRLAPAPLEQAESLEQLRVLWHGEKIAVLRTHIMPAPGVDTEQDLARIRALFAV